MPKRKSTKSILTTAMENAAAEGKENPISDPDLAMKLAARIDARIANRRFVRKAVAFTVVAAPVVFAATVALSSKPVTEWIGDSEDV